MKKLICLLLLVAISYGDNFKVSPHARFAFSKSKMMERKMGRGHVSEGCYVDPVTGEKGYRLIIQADSDIDRNLLKANGIEVQTFLENGIMTAWVPEKAIASLTQMEETRYVQLSRKLDRKMDVSRVETGVDKLYEGTGLDSPVRGDGVVVGVLDSGIDLEHPDFMDSSGKTRILYLWDQTDDSGNPPEGYSYGTLYTKSMIDGGQRDQTDTEGHGTHVAGTAAGNGQAFEDNVYRGIAPNSDLIIIKTAGEDSQLIDATAFFFRLAGEIGKPGVINMSLGGHAGPHDGSSLGEKGLTDLTGDGKIIVAAAGNEGEYTIHAGFEVGNSGELVLFEPYENEEGQISFEAWYDEEDEMEYMISIFDYDLNLLGNSNWVGLSGTLDTLIEGQNIYIDASETQNPNNQDRHVYMAIQSETVDQYVWGIGVRSSLENDNAYFDCWTQSESFGRFLSGIEGARDGDAFKTVGSPASAFNIIGVGAYNTKNTWVDEYGETRNESFSVGALASFSSVGPTRDNRLKPEICAPGNLITSVLSSQAEGESRVVDGGYYQVMEGTSMATPHITGIVALMLQVDPNLDYDEIVSHLANTARRDSDVNASGDLPNVYWGYGKVDAYEAVRNVFATSISEPVGPEAGYSIKNFPNPFQKETRFTFNLPVGGKTELTIYNIFGQKVKELISGEMEKGIKSVFWDGRNDHSEPVASGIYFLRIKNSHLTAHKKIMLVR